MRFFVVSVCILNRGLWRALYRLKSRLGGVPSTANTVGIVVGLGEEWGLHGSSQHKHGMHIFTLRDVASYSVLIVDETRSSRGAQERHYVLKRQGKKAGQYVESEGRTTEPHTTTMKH